MAVSVCNGTVLVQKRHLAFSIVFSVDTAGYCGKAPNNFWDSDCVFLQEDSVWVWLSQGTAFRGSYKTCHVPRERMGPQKTRPRSTNRCFWGSVFHRVGAKSCKGKLAHGSLSYRGLWFISWLWVVFTAVNTWRFSSNYKKVGREQYLNSKGMRSMNPSVKFFVHPECKFNNYRHPHSCFMALLRDWGHIVVFSGFDL